MTAGRTMKMKYLRSIGFMVPVTLQQEEGRTLTEEIFVGKTPPNR